MEPMTIDQEDERWITKSADLTGTTTIPFPLMTISTEEDEDFFAKEHHRNDIGGSLYDPTLRLSSLVDCDICDDMIMQPQQETDDNQKGHNTNNKLSNTNHSPTIAKGAATQVAATQHHHDCLRSRTMPMQCSFSATRERGREQHERCTALCLASLNNDQEAGAYVAAMAWMVRDIMERAAEAVSQLQQPQPPQQMSAAVVTRIVGGQSYSSQDWPDPIREPRRFTRACADLHYQALLEYQNQIFAAASVDTNTAPSDSDSRSDSDSSCCCLSHRPLLLTECHEEVHRHFVHHGTSSCSNGDKYLLDAIATDVLRTALFTHLSNQVFCSIKESLVRSIEDLTRLGGNSNNCTTEHQESEEVCAYGFACCATERQQQDHGEPSGAEPLCRLTFYKVSGSAEMWAGIRHRKANCDGSTTIRYSISFTSILIPSAVLSGLFPGNSNPHDSASHVDIAMALSTWYRALKSRGTMAGLLRLPAGVAEQRQAFAAPAGVAGADHSVTPIRTTMGKNNRNTGQQQQSSLLSSSR